MSTPMYPDVNLHLYDGIQSIPLTAADQEYCAIIQEIVNSPFSDNGQKVRPHWHDGTPAHTRKVFGHVSRYHLHNGFPIMQLRKINYRLAFEEVLWIYQKASNRLADLNGHIWDDWNVGDGTIGKAYGYQVAKKVDYKDGNRPMNQMERVLFDLCNNPMSRSIQTNLYCHEDLPEMGLRPCAFNMNYNVTMTDGESRLNGLLVQRSQDMVTANNWNVVQYAALLHLVARACGFEVGDFVHVIIDAHIYDRHEELAKEMVNAAVELGTPGLCPVMPYRVNATFNCPRGDGSLATALGIFYEATPDTLALPNYNPCDVKPKIEVAV